MTQLHQSAKEYFKIAFGEFVTWNNFFCKSGHLHSSTCPSETLPLGPPLTPSFEKVAQFFVGEAIVITIKLTVVQFTRHFHC